MRARRVVSVGRSMSYLSEALELEEELQKRLHGRRVVLEVGLTADLHEQVTAAFEPLVRSQSPAQIVRAFPALLCTYLVGHGAYHYAGGGIWTTIDVAGIDQGWGTWFKAAIRKLGLE